MATLAARPRTVEAEINYLGPMDSMPYFYAKDHERDNLALEPHRVEIADARQATPLPSLDPRGSSSSRTAARSRTSRIRSRPRRSTPPRSRL